MPYKGSCECAPASRERATGQGRAFGFLVVVALSVLAGTLVASAPFAPKVEAVGFVVNSLADAPDANPGDGVCATAGGVCTLRAALEEANANGAVADTIAFWLAGTIALSGALPELSTGNTTIAGADQAVTGDGQSLGYTCFVITSAGNTIRGLIIKGCNGVAAVWVTGANNTIGGSTSAQRNVVINNGTGILLSGTSAHDNIIKGNYVGVDATGKAAATNGTGIMIEDGAWNNVIGGSTPAERNVIAASSWAGVGLGGDGTTGNRVIGNYIGTNAAGDSALSSNPSHAGVYISYGAQNNSIGGPSSGEGNLISGNYTGVEIWGVSPSCASGNTVKGNYIGTNAAGTATVPNQAYGIVIAQAAQNNIIGGTTTAERNVISGNAWAGITIYGSDASGNLIKGNYIGTNAAGNGALPNGGAGVSLSSGAHDNIIGGAAAGERNVISGNTQAGVQIEDDITSANHVLGNYIGTNVAGNAALPNGGDGVSLSSGAHDNIIGGAAAGERNVISGNAGLGVSMRGAGNVLAANYIGTNSAGTAAIPNQSGGVSVDGENNVVGGTSAGERNVISGNAGIAVQLSGSGNLVMANYIGTDAAGSSPLPNGGDGVIVGGGPGNSLGGSTSSEGNVISGNRGAGVVIDWLAHDNTVKGNYIGTDAAGDSAVPNQGDGVLVYGENNTVGGSSAGEGNVISGNLGHGVNLAGRTGTRVVGNYVGTNAAGTAMLPNQGDGVVASAGQSTIGGATAAERNVISGNKGTGITLTSNGHVVEGNYIGVDATGASALPNGRGVNVVRAGSNTIRNNVVSGNVGVGLRIAGTQYALSGSASEPLVPTPLDGCLQVKVNNVEVFNRCVAGGQVGPIVLPITTTTTTTIYARVSSAPGYSCWAIGDTYRVDIASESSSLWAGGSGCNGYSEVTWYLYPDSLGPASGNVLQGNFIGTNVSGASSLPNGGAGICIVGWATGTVIGGTGDGQANVVAFNGSNGVEIRYRPADRNTVRGNSIHDNGGIAIDLDVDGGGVLDGPSPNDPGDLDQGANEGLNFPEIVSVSFDGVSGTACPGCTVDIYSDNDDEGRVYEGATTAGPSGAFTWAGTASGPNVTATATDADSNTSEFSPLVSADCDGDGFTDAQEEFMGTDPCDICSWPPDFDDDHWITMTDVMNVAGRFGSCAPHPLYSPRLDFNANSCVGMADVLEVAGRFGQSRRECMS